MLFLEVKKHSSWAEWKSNINTRYKTDQMDCMEHISDFFFEILTPMTDVEKFYLADLTKGGCNILLMDV